MAITQVNVLSPEIIIVSVADALHMVAGSSLNIAYRQDIKNLTGSKAMARYQRELI